MNQVFKLKIYTKFLLLTKNDSVINQEDFAKFDNSKLFSVCVCVHVGGENLKINNTNMVVLSEVSFHWKKKKAIIVSK